MAHLGFKKLKAKLTAQGNVGDPGAVAAAIGRKKYGKKKYQEYAAKGKTMEKVREKHSSKIKKRY